METKKVLVINSLSACGKAGLNVILPILGNHALPVPSLLLSGIGNIAGSERFVTDFEAHLSSTLKIADTQQFRLIVYIGYLAHAEQVSIINNALQKYAHLIDKIVVDPVCGDQGKPYVETALITAWNILIRKADIILPNVTEVGLLAGYSPPIEPTNIEVYLSTLTELFPVPTILVTSLFDEGCISNHLFNEGKKVYGTLHHYHAHHYSGTGDALASWFILLHFLQGLPIHNALQRAGDWVSAMIAYSEKVASNDLLMPDNFNNLT